MDYNNKHLEEIMNTTLAMNKNIQSNFDNVLKELLKLKQENLEIKKHSISIQKDIRPFLKSILDMQMYSFKNLNSFKTSITNISNGMNKYNVELFNDLKDIKNNFKKRVLSNHEEKGFRSEKKKHNEFSEIFLEKNNNYNKKDVKKSKINKNINKKAIDFFDP